MLNIKTIISIIALVIVAGGAFLGYSAMKANEMARQETEAKAKAEADAIAQQQKEAESLIARTKCTTVGKNFVVTLDRENSVGQDILIKTVGEDDVPMCKYEKAEADFEIKNTDPEYFKALDGKALVTDLGTSPTGRSVRLYDMTDKKLITEKQYFEDLKIASSTLVYLGLAKAKADVKNCKDFKKITDDGFTPTLVVEKTVNLETFLVKEGKTTKCIASQ
jgi:hypothetical protein